MTPERKVVVITGTSRGINVLLGEGARRIAEDVIAWVVGRLAR